MATDMTLDRLSDKGRLGSLVVDPETVSRQKKQRHAFVFQATDTAGTTYSLPLVVLDRAVRIVSATIVPAIAVTANGTNFKTVALQYTNGAGGGATSLATSVTTASVSWVALTNVPMTLNATNASSIASGNTIQCIVTPSGTGVSMSFAMDVVYEEI